MTPVRLSWERRECDVELFKRELQAFVPPAVFDAHAHLYRKADWPEPRGAVELGPEAVTLDEYRALMEWVLPGREVDGLFLGFGGPERVVEANAFVAGQVGSATGCAGAMLVTPDMDADYVRQEVRRQGFVALKPYHRFAKRQPTWDAEIEAFLPEAHVRVAHVVGRLTRADRTSRSMPDGVGSGDPTHDDKRQPQEPRLTRH